MRIVFIGLCDASFHAAKSLQKKGYDIVIIEKEKSVIDEMSKQIDCSFLLGDGSKPDILHEINPDSTDFLFCFTSHDQVNIIASLVARSIGFKNIVTRIENDQYENVCLELGLKQVIIPSRMVGRSIEDIVQGYSDMSKTIKDKARLFLFVNERQAPALIKEIELPSEAKIICLYREGNFILTEDDTEVQPGDEAVVLTNSKNIPELMEKFQSKISIPTNHTSNNP